MQKRLLFNVKSFLKSDAGISFVIALGWQFLLFGIGLFIEHLFYGKTTGPTGLLLHTSYWDSGWYNDIINGAYEKVPASAAFYPLFPLTVYLLHSLFLGSLNGLTCGFIINIFSVWVAIYALVKIAHYYVGSKYKWWVISLFLASPAAFFLHQFYSEALFCALVFSAYYFALKQKWAVMAILLGISTAARLPALLFVGLCGLEFMRSYDWNVRKIWNKNLLWFLLAPIGFVLYGLYLLLIRGNFFAMFAAIDETKDWSYHVFNPNFLATFINAAHKSAHLLLHIDLLNKYNFVTWVLPTFALGILFIFSFYSLFTKQRKLLTLGLFGFASFIFFTLNSDVVSVHRYVLPCIVIYIASVSIFKNFRFFKTLLIIILCGSFALQLYLFMLFIQHFFAG